MSIDKTFGLMQGIGLDDERLEEYNTPCYDGLHGMGLVVDGESLFPDKSAKEL